MGGITSCSAIFIIGIAVLLCMKRKKYAKYKQDAVKIIMLTAVLGIAVCVKDIQNQRLSDQNKLYRNPAGEDSATQSLQLTVPGVMEEYNYQIEVEAERYRGEKLKHLFAEASLEAEQLFLNKNPSFDEIADDVSLPKKLQDGQITASWEFEPEDIFDENGKINSEVVDEAGTLVMVSLTLGYFGQKQAESFGCLVFPKKMSAKEQILTALEQYFEKEKEHPKREAIYLPEKIDGYELEWSQKPEMTYQVILILGFLSGALICIKQKQDELERKKKRREQLVQEYPHMVSKLTLLLGAGMTLNSAWEKIVLNYQRKKKAGHLEEKAVYEEMLYSYREIQDGIGELKVYERFGERCGIRQYRKLTALIIQNLRKGSSGLTALLEKEVIEAFEVRKNSAKKAGEQAGTKLLIPMVLMLCIVMVIILVPAALSFQAI